MPKPELAAIPPFYHNYIKQVEEGEILPALQSSHEKVVSILGSIPEEKWSNRYAEGKWSILEMVQHMIDTERIFAYRALCIARGEKASLPGFDENAYAATSNAERRSKEDLLEEWTVVRKATILLYQSFTEEQTINAGTANNFPIGVDAIGFIAAGHVRHHLNILKERYGV
ncbi:MAG: DinB family protein [Chitinophagaceae bacterium]|nr:MAG: DinB family protein [Chitinophagaceae bacterium]